MIVETYKDISNSIKNVIQVVPSLSQLLFDNSDVDYQKTATSQISKVKVGVADDTIWDKTFKLRLTSKKTGKKIDLNITYNDPSVKLEE